MFRRFFCESPDTYDRSYGLFSFALLSFRFCYCMRNLSDLILNHVP